MKQLFALGLATVMTASALAQPPKTETTVRETTRVTTTEHKTTTACDADLLGPPLWSVNDAVPVPAGRVDLRLSGFWVTANAPANGGDSDDDFIMTPHVVWGVAENWELAIGNAIWLGDSGDMGPQRDGNYDTHVGLLWRFADQQGYWPAMALSSGARIPTGDGSSGVDGELRLILTNTYDSGIRSHINAYAATLNGNNERSNRYIDPNAEASDGHHLQWGFVFGLDGPLCADGAVRWVADYVLKGTRHYESSNLLDVGFQWAVAERQALGVSTQIGLDDNEETPNFGAGFTYSVSLCR